ncbi:ergothioneine biosynthesis protein EgtC [Skermania piniformis]|uniref:Gamma-glutamyl-hercynylcysteine sulfoxide hydrolase n=1 Tax=Skermania pinensis TaxID=39122 RepID=A0ABX8S5I2_9ACTN|nr:ergothioneine biosynthesis protein EgtC [Skermania piniformis]QXQ13087.1 ergothioneine biosynthesis protein EgtC [Skermania piniformis]
MCRHIGYLGPAVPVADLLTRGNHSVMTQAWAPRQMRGGGTVNADGFGVGWWAAHRFSRYRNPMPIWTDPAVTEVLPQISATAVLGAVRSATAGMPVERSACAPFTDGHWAFSHNGVVPDWPGLLRWTAAPTESATDSAAVWALLAAELQRQDPVAAIRAVIRRIIAAAPGARLNLLLGDGTRFWATTWYHSLWSLVDAGTVILASEPYDDDPRWQEIADRRLVTAVPGQVTIDALQEE